MGLELVAQAGAERKPRPHADVVLDVQRTLQVEVVDVRVSDAARVAQRAARLERLQAFERVGAQVVGEVVGRHPGRIGHDPHAHGVDAAHVVQVRCQVHAARAASAGHLLPATRERVVDADRLSLHGRRGHRIVPADEEACVHEEPAAQRAGFLETELVVPVLGSEGALHEVVGADALVPKLVRVAVEPDAQHLVLGERIVHVRVDVDELPRHPHEHRFGANTTRRERRVDIGRLERGGPVQVDVVAQPVADERASEEELIILRALGPLFLRERAAAAHRAVPQPHLRAASQRPLARLRDDVDEDAPRRVELRGEGVARDANRADLRLGRQLRALEAVYPDHGVAPHHFGQLPAHLLRIVRERVDLLARQRRAESHARIGRVRLRVLPHRDGVLLFLQGQHHGLAVFPLPHAHVPGDALFEPGELDLDGIAPLGQVGEHRHALLGGDNRRDLRLTLRVLTDQAHVGGREDRSGLIRDSDREAAAPGGLRQGFSS